MACHPSSRRVPLSRATPITAGGAALLLMPVALMPGGCERAGVEERVVEKGVEAPPPPPPPAAEPSPPVAADAHPWSVPADWTLDPAPRPMRVATYTAPDASGPVEVAVTRFGGQVGGELANINRWRGQMGLDPLDEGGLDGAIDRFSAPGFAGYQARLEGASGVMLAAGVYDEAADHTWFVRATAPDGAAADRLEGPVFSVARSIAGVAAEPGG